MQNVLSLASGNPSPPWDSRRVESPPDSSLLKVMLNFLTEEYRIGSGLEVRPLSAVA